MFEGNPIPAPDSRSSVAGDTAENPLCELNWADLTARLAAARELRAELAITDDCVLASFDAESARHLASQPGGFRHGYDQRDVNPDDLGNCKGRTAKHFSRADRDTATRGNT